MMFLVFMTCMQFCFLDCLRVIFSLRFWQSSLVCVEPFCRALIFLQSHFARLFSLHFHRAFLDKPFLNFLGLCQSNLFTSSSLLQLNIELISLELIFLDLSPIKCLIL